MNDLLYEMGQRLSVRRKQLGLTQEVVAEQAGLTTQTVSTAETGSKALRPENILKLCDVLGISADYLLRGEVSETDVSMLAQRTAQLSPTQFFHLEAIIKNYIEAVTGIEDKA